MAVEIDDAFGNWSRMEALREQLTSGKTYATGAPLPVAKPASPQLRLVS